MHDLVKPPPPKKQATREERLAEALRANLQRRKAHARARQERSVDSPEQEQSPPPDKP
ncbi:MAG: hypothetical protein WC807_08210 [Hyphomicrobium sp.]